MICLLLYGMILRDLKTVKSLNKIVLKIFELFFLVFDAASIKRIVELNLID